MNSWIIVAIIAGLLLFAGAVVIINSKPVKADVADFGGQQGSCAYGSQAEGCPYAGQGGCTQESNCGLDTCAAKYGGSCGCSGNR